MTSRFDLYCGRDTVSRAASPDGIAAPGVDVRCLRVVAIDNEATTGATTPIRSPRHAAHLPPRCVVDFV